MVIDAPDTGIIRSVSAIAGQSVPAGAALFEVMDLDQVWVRVPVYVGDLAETDTTHSAQLGRLHGCTGSPSRGASVVPAPPLANPAVGTVDLFYTVTNWKPDDPRWSTAECVVGFGLPGFDRTRYSPGERVGVSLALRDPSESLTAPWGAVVIDVYGGTWVYERVAERTYTRHRVIVRFVRDGASRARDRAEGRNKSRHGRRRRIIRSGNGVLEIAIIQPQPQGCGRMLSALISNSVRLRVVVLALCVVLLVVGSRSIRRAPLDVFPEFAPPLVEIQTEAPGLSTSKSNRSSRCRSRTRSTASRTSRRCARSRCSGSRRSC